MRNLNWSRCELRMRLHAQACVPVQRSLMAATGQWRCIFKKLLSAADRWPTRPWIACLTSTSGVLTTVSNCSGVRWESHLLTDYSDRWRWVFFPSLSFFSVTQPKRDGIDIWGWKWIDKNQSSHLTEQNP